MNINHHAFIKMDIRLVDIYHKISCYIYYVMLNNHTWLSRPRRSTIKKKRTDQNWGPGNIERALGYAMNASPGPEIK